MYCRTRKAEKTALEERILREVKMGWLVPAAMLAMVVIAAVTITRL